MKHTPLFYLFCSLALAAGLSLAACASTELVDETETSGDSNASDPTNPDSNIIQATKTFPGELSDWCTGQPENFTFFVTSMDAIWKLSDSTPDDWSGGFGGDFQGIEGADSICQLIGIATGHGEKRWRAFLSATDDGSGNPIHAIERIGQGPWYDANGRLVASDIQGLLNTRPDGDAQSVDDLPDECGVPLTALGDAHDIPTASDEAGRLRSTDPESTCYDWTSSDPNVAASSSGGGPGSNASPTNLYCGHSFPRQHGGGGGGPGGGTSDNGQKWMSDHKLRGCGKGANLLQNGGGEGGCIGCSGGYGGLYCFVEAE